MTGQIIGGENRPRGPSKWSPERGGALSADFAAFEARRGSFQRVLYRSILGFENRSLRQCDVLGPSWWSRSSRHGWSYRQTSYAFAVWNDI